MLRLVRSTVNTWKRWSKRRPSPLSSDCFDLQTELNYKSIQNICKTPVFHLCHQRIGGFPWVWGKSIEDQVVLLVRLKVIPGWYHEGVVHMKRNDTCIMIKKNVSITPLLIFSRIPGRFLSSSSQIFKQEKLPDIFSETWSILAPSSNNCSCVFAVLLLSPSKWKS